MRAVVVDPESEARLSVAEVEEPDPAPSEALVRVAAVSLNRGEVLGNALSMLAPEGTCVSFGTSSGPEVTFDARDLYLAGGAKLYGFIIFHEVQAQPASQGLARLAKLIEEGRLKPRIEVEAPWTDVGTVAARLTDRGYTGKAVLHVS